MQTTLLELSKVLTEEEVWVKFVHKIQASVFDELHSDHESLCYNIFCSNQKNPLWCYCFYFVTD